MSNERFETFVLEGNAIASAVDLLSELRMEIFREYPYL